MRGNLSPNDCGLTAVTLRQTGVCSVFCVCRLKQKYIRVNHHIITDWQLDLIHTQTDRLNLSYWAFITKVVLKTAAERKWSLSCFFSLKEPFKKHKGHDFLENIHNGVGHTVILSRFTSGFLY